MLSVLLLLVQAPKAEYIALRDMTSVQIQERALKTSRTIEQVENSRLIRLGKLEYILSIPFSQHKGKEFHPDPDRIRSGRSHPPLSTRGDFLRDNPIEFVADVSTYKPSDSDGGGPHTAMGHNVQKGCLAVRYPWLSKLKRSTVWVEGYGLGHVCDTGSFYGKTNVALDAAFAGRSWGIRPVRIVIVNTKNPGAWKEYLSIAHQATVRKRR